MADDYARYALSQRAAFEATHPAALSAARRFAAEPVLRVVDLGAADGVNSHGLIRSLVRERGGRKLAYALVDLPTNVWGVAAEHLQNAFPRASASLGSSSSLPMTSAVRGSPMSAPASTTTRRKPTVRESVARSSERRRGAPSSAWLASHSIRRRACPRALCMSRSPGQRCTGSRMRQAWSPRGPSSRATRITKTIRSVEHGGPPRRDSGSACSSCGRTSSRPVDVLWPRFQPRLRRGSERAGLYVQLIADMNAILAEWCREGRIDAGTVSAIVVPVWMRTLDEIRAPFEENGGSVSGLELESAELFRLDNPYWDDDPEVFARSYVGSASAWGGPIFLRAFERERDGRRASGLLDAFLAELKQRIAEAPARYRWDYVEALIVCRKLE